MRTVTQDTNIYNVHCAWNYTNACRSENNFYSRSGNNSFVFIFFPLLSFLSFYLCFLMIETKAQFIGFIPSVVESLWSNIFFKIIWRPFLSELYYVLVCKRHVLHAQHNQTKTTFRPTCLFLISLAPPPCRYEGCILNE